MTNMTDRTQRYKHELLTKWHRLSSEDIDEVAFDLTRLKEKLKERHSLSDEEATIEAQRFMDSFDQANALTHHQWEDLGALITHEQDHPEREIIRSHKDGGRYGTADSSSDLHQSNQFPEQVDPGLNRKKPGDSKAETTKKPAAR